MKEFLEIKIRISQDVSGNSRFTKEEVENLIKKDKVKFFRNLICRKSDGEVVGELCFDEL